MSGKYADEEGARIIRLMNGKLDEDPSDGETRRVLSLVLTGVGQHSLARVHQWMVSHGKYPLKGEKGSFFFFSLGKTPARSHAYVGGWIAAEMPYGDLGPAEYSTRAKAEQALGKALAKLKYPEPVTR